MADRAKLLYEEVLKVAVAIRGYSVLSIGIIVGIVGGQAVFKGSICKRLECFDVLCCDAVIYDKSISDSPSHTLSGVSQSQ